MSNIEADDEHKPPPAGPDPAEQIRGRLFVARGRHTKEVFAMRMGGIDPDTVSNYEKGATKRMSWRTLRDWAAASDIPGVTLDWLIGDWTVPKGDEQAQLSLGPMSADPLAIVNPSDLTLA